MSDYTRLTRADATDWMAEYPGFGEMRSTRTASEPSRWR